MSLHKDSDFVRERLLRTMKYGLLLLIAGVCYGIIVERTGFALAVPCLFRLVTGWKCPGCGVTHMCVALLHLDFETAFRSNQALFVLSPILGIWFAWYVVEYIKTGKGRAGGIQNAVLYICIAVLLLFGVVRNLQTVFT